MSIFKAYDIRGVYPDQMDEALGRKIGAALARLLDAKTLVVGRDMRASAPSVQAAIMDGITSQGCDVLDIGLASTPMVYYAIGTLDSDGGLATTASHNPPEYIGAKLCRRGAVPMSSETGIADLERMVQEEDLSPRGTPGTIKAVSITEDYKAHLHKSVNPWSPRKIVVDTANGMGGLEVPLVLDDSPLDWSGLFLELDGTFPNHEANPLKDENLEDLRKKVLETGADVGFAYDGDADRCCVIDEKGDRVGSDLVTALLARHFLAEHPGSAIVYDLRSSRVLPEEIERLGGRPIQERVGHSFLKATMRKEDAPFGGELSGHFYFRDHSFSDCATLAMIHLLNLMEAEGKPLSELVAPLLRYHSTGEVNYVVEDPDAMLAMLKDRYSDGDVSELDGVSVVYPTYWFNVRKSNTEPLVRLRLEATSADELAKRTEELGELLGTPE